MKFWNFRNSYRISLLAACHSVVCISSQYVDSKDLDSEDFSTWEDLELDDHWKKTNIAENSSPLAHKPLFSHTKIKIYTNYLTNWALSHTALATSYKLGWKKLGFREHEFQNWRSVSSWWISMQTAAEVSCWAGAWQGKPFLLSDNPSCFAKYWLELSNFL